MPTTPAEDATLDNDSLLEQFFGTDAYRLSLERTKEAMEMRFRILATRLANGEDVPHAEIQYERGWYACLKNLLDQPRLASETRARARKDVTELG